MKLRYLAIAMMAYAGPVFAQNDDLKLDAARHGWAAFHHTPDGGLHVDLCLISNDDGSFGMRADENDIEIITIDNSWNLSPKTRGDLYISSGDYGETFNVSPKGTHQLRGTINALQASDIIKVMNSSKRISLLFGEKTKKDVSLVGADLAVNSFVDCVRASGFADLPSLGKDVENSPF